MDSVKFGEAADAGDVVSRPIVLDGALTAPGARP